MNTTIDAFLGGRLQVHQSAKGYRAGADPVFLAAAVPVRSGQTVLELGCGVGVALLCLLARVPDAQVWGVERDTVAAELAKENLATNGMTAEIEVADLAAMPQKLRAKSFDHVMANPPYFDRALGSTAENPGREAGRGEDTPLSTWIDSALRRLSPSGTLTLVQRVDRLPECMAALDNRVGDVVVLPLAPRRAKPAKIFIMQAKKGAKGSFQLSPPFKLHKGDRHKADGESYTEAAKAILRHGAPLHL